METEIPTIKLGDVCSKIGSGATPRGGSDVYIDSGVALIRSQNVYNNEFTIDGLAFISDRHAEELENVSVEENDVLLNITGDSIARCCQVPEVILPARVNQHVAIIRPDPDILNPRFLRYYLVSPYMQTYMLTLSSAGGTRKALTKGMINDFEIPAFSLNDQLSIAEVLGSLDDKLELNRQMNHTLESLARTIFKSWFVDFDPVRAKAEGRQPVGMDTETAALFPDALEKSALGEIPRGWEIKTLDEIADYLNGLALQKYPADGDNYLPVIKIAQMRKNNTEGADRASTNISSEYIIHDGDVLFSWSGSLEVMLWSGGKGALNQHLFKVTSENYPKWFYYLWTQFHLPDFQLIAAGKATTMGHIQRHHLSEALVVVPPRNILARMSDYLAPLIYKQIANSVQSQTLATLRDALLPRLMSGEVRVKNLSFSTTEQGLWGS